MSSHRLVIFAFAAIALAFAAGCVLGEHVSSSAIPYLERVAFHLDKAENRETSSALNSECESQRTWQSDSGRDGQIVREVCDRALVTHDWQGARKVMLDAFPFAVRQKHLE